MTEEDSYRLKICLIISFQHQVRTLFVSGLPLDTKSRELYLLFRGFKVSFICFPNIRLFAPLFQAKNNNQWIIYRLWKQLLPKYYFLSFEVGLFLLFI